MKKPKPMIKDSEVINLPSKGEITGFYKKVSQDRFKSFKGYTLDRWLFQFIMWGLFFFLGLFVYINDFELDYYMCDPGIDPFTGLSSESCENPFYKPASWKNHEYLPAGEYGKKPTTLFNSLWIITIGAFILGAILNHLLHNRGHKKNDLL